jgi:antitoxin (DNA-binding transcriptional repressor) of toxin-antitoxin stability system
MEVSATEFKIHCLDLLDRVQETGQVLRITKRGKVVAELHPPTNPAPAVPAGFGLLASTGKIHGDIIAPIDDVPWENLGDSQFGYPSAPDAARINSHFVAEESRAFDSQPGTTSEER